MEHSASGGSSAKAAWRAAAAARTRRLASRARWTCSGTRAADTSRMITTQPPATCSAPTTAWSITSGTRASTPCDHNAAARPWSWLARMIQSPPSRTCLITRVWPSARTTRSSRLPERPSAAASGSLLTTSTSSDVTTRLSPCARSWGQDRRPGCSPVAARRRPSAVLRLGLAHVPLAELGAAAVGVEAEQEQVVVLVADGAVGVEVAAVAPGHRLVGGDQHRAVGALVGPGLVAVPQPVGDDRVPPPERLGERVVPVDGVGAEQRPDLLGVVGPPGVAVAVQPGRDRPLVHDVLLGQLARRPSLH